MSPLTHHTGFAEAQARTAADTRSIGAEFLRQVRRGPRVTAIQDFRGRMSRLRLAAVALSLIPLLDLEPDEERVGVEGPATGPGGGAGSRCCPGPRRPHRRQPQSHHR